MKKKKIKEKKENMMTWALDKMGGQIKLSVHQNSQYSKMHRNMYKGHQPSANLS